MIADQIVAAFDDEVLILNSELETVERFISINTIAKDVEGNEEYIAVRCMKGQVCFHTRNRDCKPTVSDE